MNSNTNGNPVVSVVIPCFNARGTILKTLQAVQKQNFNEKYDVWVVDSSTDGTDALIRDNFPEVNLLRLDRQTLPGSGRNLGVQKSGGEIIAFTDSDCVPEPDWLERLVQRHRELDTHAIGGSVINGYPKSPTAWISHLIEFSEWTETTPAGYEDNNPSCNLSVKREVFTDMGLFYTDVFPSEDTLFNWSLKLAGGKLFFDPRVCIVHLSRVGLNKLFSHQKRLGLASAEARRRTDMPGKMFVKYPVLCLLLPPIRWVRASIRLIKKDIPKTLLFWLLTPLYLLAAVAWTAGFMSRGEYEDPRYLPTGNDTIDGK